MECLEASRPAGSFRSINTTQCSSLLLGRIVRASVGISVGVALSGLLALGSGGVGGGSVISAALSFAGSLTGHLAFGDIVLLVLVLGASLLLVSEVGGLESSDLALSDTVVITLLVLALLGGPLEVKFSQGGVTVGGVVGIVGLAH